MPLEHLSEKGKTALEKAVELLLKHGVSDELEAYYLLVKHEKTLGYPVTYEFVIEALRIAEARRMAMYTARAEAKAAV
ncbi:hypothetical protein [Pyrolobus fumarii]|nr:hypothetical protein [Pyrolobus fumarii]